MNRDEFIDEVVWLTKIRPLLIEASDIIEALKPGERIPATEIARIVAERHGMTGPQLYPSLKFMITNEYPGVKVSRGAHGGVEKLDPSESFSSDDLE